MYALGVALGCFGYTDVDKSYIILTVINWLLWTSKKQLVFILCVAQIHCFAKLWRTWSNRFANFREDMEIIWFGWQKRTQIRQGGPWPDRDQTVTGLNFGVTGLNFGVTGLNFGVTHPPPKKKTFYDYVWHKKNMWNINWVRSVQLLLTEMIVIWLRMEDSKHWIHPNLNVYLWLKGKQRSPKVLNHIIVQKSQYEASWLILGAIQPGSTMSIPVAVVN